MENLSDRRRLANPGADQLSRLNRRRLLTLIGSLAGGALALPSHIAHAEDMCASDPILKLNNERFNIILAIPLTVKPYITTNSPVRYEVHVPTGVRTSVTYDGVFPEVVRFVYDNACSTMVEYQSVSLMDSSVASPDGSSATQSMMSKTYTQIRFRVTTPTVPNRSSYPCVLTTKSSKDVFGSVYSMANTTLNNTWFSLYAYL